MNLESREFLIEELIQNGLLLVNDGYRAKNSELACSGIPFARAGNINQGFHFEDADRVPRETLARVGLKRSKPGDVVFTSKGTVGRFAFVREKTPEFVYSPQLCFWRSNDKNRIDPYWLYYWMNGREFFLQYKGVSGQTDMAEYVSLRDQRAMRITLPPITEQKIIAHILGTLDDKIELNRRMNATLEGMAQALFQSWFVDFDPVRAKFSGHAPVGLDSVTATLFPNRFQSSPIGRVPQGWKVERFDTHITADRGLSYKGDGLRDDCSGLPMHNLNSIYEGGGYKHEGIKYYAGEYREKHLLVPGDMIVSNTEQGFDHLLIGHAAIVPKNYGAKGLFSHHLYRVRHKPSSPFSPHYLVELFNNRRWHYWISGFSNGTTINMLPMDALEMPMLVVPPLELVMKFTALAEAIHSQVEANLHQSRTLAALRDSLLPQLFEGKLCAASIAHDTNIVSFSTQPPHEPVKKATDEFVEAVVIAQLVRKLAKPEFPLGRKRYNKLAYLAHRKAEDDVSQHYLKKAAGPYSPWAKYGGPEKIAEKNGYVKQGKAGVYSGLISGDHIDKIDQYLANYPVCASIEWVVDKFRFKKNDDLELLATVDFAALDLLREEQPITRDAIKHVIAANKEWAPKLDRAIFSDESVDRALAELAQLFPATYPK